MQEAFKRNIEIMYLITQGAEAMMYKGLFHLFTVSITLLLMLAGSATRITDFDKWMLRDFWRHIKSR